MFENGFGGFRFGGGFPFGGGEAEEEPKQKEEKEKDNKLYEIIGVQPSANTDEIRRAYKKKVVKLHPDKGGDPEMFKELQEAYEILNNPEKRDIYDKYGMEGIKESAQGGHPGGFDIFDHLFNFGSKKKDNKPKKAKPVLKEIKIKLEDVYVGKMLHEKITRKRVCESCNGKGGENEKTCNGCKGRGMVEKMMMLGPGMYQHSSQPCKECRGEGKIIEEKDKCKSCKGKKVFDQEKVLDVALEPGVPEEHDYVCHGEADEYPGIMAGDVYFRVFIEKHKTFVRKGADLWMEKKITLVEALTGFSFEVNHLDGKKIKVGTMPGEIIQPGINKNNYLESIKCIKKKGLPFYKDQMSFGNLYIKFNVNFPKKGELKENQINEIRKIFNHPIPEKFDKKAKVEYLKDYNDNDLNPSPEGGKGRSYTNEDDDPYGGGGPRVQCAQQ